MQLVAGSAAALCKGSECRLGDRAAHTGDVELQICPRLRGARNVAQSGCRTEIRRRYIGLHVGVRARGDGSKYRGRGYRDSVRERRSVAERARRHELRRRDPLELLSRVRGNRLRKDPLDGSPSARHLLCVRDELRRDATAGRQLRSSPVRPYRGGRQGHAPGRVGGRGSQDRLRVQAIGRHRSRKHRCGGDRADNEQSERKDTHASAHRMCARSSHGPRLLPRTYARSPDRPPPVPSSCSRCGLGSRGARAFTRTLDITMHENPHANSVLCQYPSRVPMSRDRRAESTPARCA
jgi:hypothetical protein